MMHEGPRAGNVPIIAEEGVHRALSHVAPRLGLALLFLSACTLFAAMLRESRDAIVSGTSECVRYPFTCEVFSDVAQRVLLMREVAAAKATARGRTLDQVCVYNSAQELKILAAAAGDAALASVSMAAAFTAAQLQADCGKQEQAYWISIWDAAGTSVSYTHLTLPTKRVV